MEGCTSEIAQFFKDQVIFITGSTGFLGKMLLEKMLRSCPDLKKVYLLLRVKKEKSEQERFEEIFASECFEPLKAKYPNFKEKVFIINGDCVKPNLGISDEDKNIMLNEVNTIFHVAATTRFDQHLKSATYINVRAVYDLVQIAKEMKQLKAFVHVSTAFSHCPRTNISEQFYGTPISGEKLITVMDCLDDDTVTKITPIIIQDWPNSYVFTKAVAENIIETCTNGLPVTMVRPAIVVPSWAEPVPGWVDNIYGCVGVTLGVAMGVIRTMRADPDNYAIISMADFVINNIIAAAWDVAKDKELILDDDTSKSTQSHVVPIYHNLNQVQKPFKWGKFHDTCMQFSDSYPCVKQIWPVVFSIRKNLYTHRMAMLFLHTIPAYIVDFVLKCMGKKPLMVEGYKKIHKFMEIISYFAMKRFHFTDDNAQALYKKLSPLDQELFNFSMSIPDFNYKEYCLRSCLGGRKYLIKESLDTVPEAKKKLMKLKIAHYVLCSFLLYFFCKIVMFILRLLFNV